MASTQPDLPPPPPRGRLNIYTFAVAFLASTNSTLLGYDIGVMSGAKILIQKDLNISDNKIDVLTGSLNVISLVGSLLAGKTSDCIGRRYTIVLAAVTFLLGALLMGLAPSFPYLMAGRLIAGVGVGYSLMIAPVYTAEISPASTRGFLGSLPEVFINVGILLGYLMNFLLVHLPRSVGWRVMLGLAAIPALGIIVGVLVMPESPRWLVMKGRMAEAKKVLVRTSEGGEQEAATRLEDIQLAAAAAVSCSEGRSVWKELLRPTDTVRRVLIAAVGLNFFMQASGNDAVVYYTPEVFREAGVHKNDKLFLVTVIMGVAKTTFVLLSALFLDRFGRRPLLLIGSSGMVLSLLGLGLGTNYLYNSVKKPMWAIALCIVAVSADVSFFSIGLGPITWIYSCEIFPLHLRAQGSSIAISVNRVVSGAVTMGFPMLARKMTFSGVFFVFAGIAAVGTIFFYMFLPETSGENLEDIQELFERKRKNVEDRIVEQR